jgi:hypothetical protein
MLRKFFLVLGLLSLTACSAPAERANMAASYFRPLNTPSDVSLIGGIVVGTVDGGQSTNPLWTSEVGTEEFRGALIDSLRNYGLFAEGTSAPRYILNAHLVGVEQPLIGINMTVKSTINYELVDASTYKALYGDSLQKAYTASSLDAFYGATRLKLANEGAIRQNIKEYIERLYRKPPFKTQMPVALR